VTKKLAIAVLMCVAAGSLLAAAPPKLGKGPKAKAVKGRVKAVRAKDAPHVVGTVTYDTGTNNAGFSSGSGTNVGNRFNSALGAPLLNTGNVSALSIFPAGSAGYVTVFGPPNTMGTASNLGSFQFTGAAPAAFNVVGLPGIAVGPDFLAGVWQNGPSVAVGMDNLTVGGQGFHAFNLNTNFPGAGTGFAPIPTRNALVRATGNILVPVELMNFSVQ
jgi:hypothetical protein